MKSLLALTFAALAACGTASAAVLNAGVEPSTAAVEESGAPGQSAREDYEQRARNRLDVLSSQLDDARKEASTLAAEARRQADARVADLKSQTDDAQKQVSELEREGEQRWQIVRKHLDSTLDSLRREYEGLRRDLDHQSGAAPAPASGRQPR